MPFELKISELNDFQKANEFISCQDTHITLNMLKKYVGIRPKVGFRVLRSHPNTMLSEPLVFGSNQNRMLLSP